MAYRSVMDEEPTTPRELAAEIGVSDRTIRVFLRAEYPEGRVKYQPWLLTREQANAVRAHFRLR